MKSNHWVTIVAGCIAAVLTYLAGQIGSGQIQLPPALDALAPVIVFALTILTKDIRAEAATGEPVGKMAEAVLTGLGTALTTLIMAQVPSPAAVPAVPTTTTPTSRAPADPSATAPAPPAAPAAASNDPQAAPPLPQVGL